MGGKRGERNGEKSGERRNKEEKKARTGRTKPYKRETTKSIFFLLSFSSSCLSPSSSFLVLPKLAVGAIHESSPISLVHCISTFFFFVHSLQINLKSISPPHTLHHPRSSLLLILTSFLLGFLPFPSFTRPSFLFSFSSSPSFDSFFSYHSLCLS